MATAPPTTTVKKASFWKSRNFLLGAAITALVAGGGVTYALWPTNYDKLAAELAKKGPEEMRKAVESGQIPREVAWEAFGAAREMEMQKQMNTFFALKTPADRNKFLDKMIDEQQARMREWQQRATTRPARPEGERRERGPTTQPDEARRKEMEQRRNERADKQSPTQRAQRVEFMMAMRKRMEERGMQMPGGGGMRGFGGPGGGRGGDGPRGGGGR